MSPFAQALAGWKTPCHQWRGSLTESCLCKSGPCGMLGKAVQVSERCMRAGSINVSICCVQCSEVQLVVDEPKVLSFVQLLTVCLLSYPASRFCPLYSFKHVTSYKCTVLRIFSAAQSPPRQRPLVHIPDRILPVESHGCPG